VVISASTFHQNVVTPVAIRGKPALGVEHGSGYSGMKSTCQRESFASSHGGYFRGGETGISPASTRCALGHAWASGAEADISVPNQLRQCGLVQKSHTYMLRSISDRSISEARDLVFVDAVAGLGAASRVLVLT
jgi:hypothetical protein